MLPHLRRVLEAVRSKLKIIMVAAALDGWLTPAQAQALITALGLKHA
jgi:hypothetical protein